MGSSRKSVKRKQSETVEMTISLLGTIGAIIASNGLVVCVTLPWIIKKARSEARASELANVQKAVDEWKKIADERQEQVSELYQREKQYLEEREQLNKKIDELYVVNSGWRDRYNDLQTENTRLQVKAATDEVKLCMRRNCPQREPQSGY